MGEETKEENKSEEKREEVKKKDEEKKEESTTKEEEVEDKNKKDEAVQEPAETEPEEIVLKVDMHCEACARKVARALKGFQGVEKVTTDCKASKVVVKGKVAAADPIKVCQRIQKKTGRKVELISPIPKPKPPPQDNNDTNDNNNNNKPAENKEESKEDKKDEPPAVITVVLNVRMHCEPCAQVLQKRIRKIKGVESVTTDIANDKVIVKGVLDPDKLVSDVYKKTRKQALVVKEEEKKEEEKKDEEKKAEKPEDDKKQEVANKEEEDKKADIKKSEYYPPSYHMEYAYAYPPQMFSDENPNACSVM